MSGLLEVKDVSAGYRGEPVLEAISFHVNPGGIACLLGPSGCGKTTLLRTIAGFEPVLAGDIRV
ncbi:MAG: ATP-binding cassette domain-containing protein, partial [Gammaproteobacteria bacterium]|nr:ATP-binding cassette domain-containing protein [Gammaproteobacteria bacterium]NIW87058.1 ATP-binding cassette domain-containing protein [Gammaproteobacteria bacterium]